MHEIRFSPEITSALPDFRMIQIEANIINAPTDDNLWREITEECSQLASSLSMGMIRHRPAIDGTRLAYKKFGKEPNRYRPSAEALSRRAVKGLGLYRSLVGIDLVNLISLKSGYSIGGFDADKIQGSVLTLGVGRDGEPYEAIGRGLLNIAGLPVYRDEMGGIGTPTSDNERTKLSPETCRILLTVNIYKQSEMPDDVFLALTERLLKEYASASDIRISHWNPVS